jgi:hypothetical protein
MKNRLKRLCVTKDTKETGENEATPPPPNKKINLEKILSELYFE